MWTRKKSIYLSKLCVIEFIILLVGLIATAPWLVNLFLSFSRASLQGTKPYFLATIYIGAVPAAILLYSLLKLLEHIELGDVFIEKNVTYLRHISWACFAGALIAIASSFYYIPWVFIAIAAAFMGLIVRVVKNIVGQAVELKNESDYTI
jgi:hypothetical protein